MITAPDTVGSASAVTFFSGYMFADMEVERRPACYRVAADKAAGKCCVHHFAGGWNKMVSRCRPAGKFRSHQSENEAIWKKKEEEKCRRCVGLAASFCLTSTSAAASFRLPVAVIHLGVSSLFGFLLFTSTARGSYFSLLSCADDVRAGSSGASCFC